MLLIGHLKPMSKAVSKGSFRGPCSREAAAQPAYAVLSLLCPECSCSRACRLRRTLCDIEDRGHFALLDAAGARIDLCTTGRVACASGTPVRDVGALAVPGEARADAHAIPMGVRGNALAWAGCA